MRFEIRTPDDAARALEYFNHFHDGALESLELRVVTGGIDGADYGYTQRYDVDIRVVHDNYPARWNARGAPNRIALSLRDVTALQVGDVVPLRAEFGELRVTVADDGVVHLDLLGDGTVTFSTRSLSIEEAAR